MRLVCIGLLCSLFACSHDDDHEAYASYQACFDEHTTTESLSITEAIVVCCLDHPIAGMTQPVCGNSAAECNSYLSANLTAGATTGDKSAGCDQYLVEKNR